MNSDPGREKARLWAAHPRVVGLPRAANPPRFASKKFDSYEAFDAWKTEFQREWIRRGGVQWTR